MKFPKSCPAKDTVVVCRHVQKTTLAGKACQRVVIRHVHRNAAGQGDRPARHVVLVLQFRRIGKNNSLNFLIFKALNESAVLVGDFRRRHLAGVDAHDKAVFQRIVPDMTGQLIVEETVGCNEPRRGRPIDEHQQYADKTKC